MRTPQPTAVSKLKDYPVNELNNPKIINGCKGGRNLNRTDEAEVASKQ